MVAAGKRALRPARRLRQQRRRRPRRRPRVCPRRTGGSSRAQRDRPASRDAGRGHREWQSGAGGGSSTSARPPASAPRRRCPSTRLRRPPSYRSRASSPIAMPGQGVLVNAVCPGPTPARRCGWSRAACSTSPRELVGAFQPRRGAGGRRSQAPDRPARRGRRDRRGDRLPLLGARLLCRRRRLERSWRHCAGDHLWRARERPS